MRARWIEQRAESALRRIALAPLVPASAGYALAARSHRAWYQRGLARRERLPCRVLAVGSPVVGGSGKTPLTAWLAAHLHRRGLRVAVASRGYGRRGSGLQVVSDGRRLCAPLASCGDEPLWLAGRLPGVPVLVARDRVAAGRRAVAAFGTEILILDDGLQHHRLVRDVSIATLDAGFGLGNGWILPRGPVREPLRALAYADALAIVRDAGRDGLGGPEGLAAGAELPGADLARIEGAAPGLQRFGWLRRARGVRALSAPRGSRGESCTTLDGLELGALCAIARSAGFVETLESLGARVVALRALPDHHRFRPRDLRGLGRLAPIWITTEKDALKLHPGWARGVDVRVLASELEPEPGSRFGEWLRDRLERC